MYSVQERLTMAQNIDTILGTKVATTENLSSVDMLLDWLTAVANAIKAGGITMPGVTPPASPTVAQLQGQISALQAQVTNLQTDVQNLIAQG